MRKLFSRQLIEARHEMLSIFQAVDLNLHDAVKALVTRDKQLASKTKKATLALDARCANLEALCYNLIATQSPVASDFRLLQTIIYVEFNLERMNNHVRSITLAAKRVAKLDHVPEELTKIVKREAQLVYRVMGATISVLVSNDLSKLADIVELEAPVHEAYEEYFRTYNRLIAGDAEAKDAGVKKLDDFRRVFMSARYLDRLATVSVEIAARVVFLVTGQRYSVNDLQDAIDVELEAQRVPSGEGVLLNPLTDASCVSQLPVDEIDPELADLVRRAKAGETDAELEGEEE